VVGVGAAEISADFDLGGFAFANIQEISEDSRRTIFGLVDRDFLDASDVDLVAVVLDSVRLASFCFSLFVGAALGVALEEVTMEVADVA